MKMMLPLWIIDPVSAEKKLDGLASQGKKLVSMGFFGNCTFEDAAPRQVHHRIVLEKGGLKKGTAAKGWEELCSGKLFYVTCNENTDEDISYTSYRTLHSILKMLCFFGICGCIGMFSGMIMARVDMEKETLFVMPDTLIYSLIMIAVGAIWAAFIICDKKMPGEATKMGGYMKTIPEENFIYDKAAEKRMLKEKTMKMMLKPGWFYAPDKAEQWVEDMARQGWVFYRFDPAGMCFYFLKEESAKLKFVVDYQNVASDEYYQLIKDEGWKLEFTSVSRTMGFTIWTKRWDDDEEEPYFYSDIADEYARAKRMTLTFGLTFALMIVVCIGLMVLYFTTLAEDDSLPALLEFVIVYTVITIEYLIFLIRLIGYFFRVKAKTK